MGSGFHFTVQEYSAGDDKCGGSDDGGSPGVNCKNRMGDLFIPERNLRDALPGQSGDLGYSGGSADHRIFLDDASKRKVGVR